MKLAANNLEQWFHTIVIERAPGVRPGLIRGGLLALSCVYGLFIEGYKLLFRLGVLKTIRLPCRVVSVGNLTMGGVGKTVAVQSLARALQGAGYRCVILSYGFRAVYEGDYAVISDYEGVRMSAEESGDEAALLASALPGIPVLIGKRRPLSGAAAVRLFNPDFILLDDGFQHWRLHRDVDLMLLDARKPLSNGRVFPAGLLREFPFSLRRASACLLTRCDFATPEVIQETRRLLKRLAPGIPLLETIHVPGKPYPVWKDSGKDEGGRTLERMKDEGGRMKDEDGGEQRPLPACGEGSKAPNTQHLTPNTQHPIPHTLYPTPYTLHPVFVVLGIGQNEAFVESLQRAGVEIGGVCAYPNHYAYSASDVTAILQQASGCAAVLTTEKDAVKLASLWRGPLPLLAVPVQLGGISEERWLELCGRM